jgi:hypothetical protein
MIENFTKKAISLAEIVHRRFFGDEMSEEMRMDFKYT